MYLILCLHVVHLLLHHFEQPTTCSPLIPSRLQIQTDSVIQQFSDPLSDPVQLLYFLIYWIRGCLRGARVAFITPVTVPRQSIWPFLWPWPHSSRTIHFLIRWNVYYEGISKLVFLIIHICPSPLLPPFSRGYLSDPLFPTCRENMFSDDNLVYT